MVLLCFFSAFQANAKPKLKRICAAKNGVNTVYWFKYEHNCQQFNSIEIYARENEFATYKLIATIADENLLSYEHLLATTFQQGSYFLKYNLICNGNTEEHFTDTITVDVDAPPVMDPDSISVGANGEIFIGWSPSTAADAKSYVIYRVDGSINKIIDEVDGRFSTSYTDAVNGDAANRSEKYKIAPTDSCDNIAPIGNFHQTVLLKISQDKCKAEVYLDWTDYIGWKEGIERYDIYYSTDGNFNYYKAAQTTNSQFTARLLPNNKQVYFFVRAIKNGNNNITSSSNRVNIVTNFEDSTQFLYLSNVTFQKNTSTLQVDWYVETGHNYLYFDVKRGVAPGLLQNIARVNASNLTQYSYTEPEPDSNYVWYYQISGVSVCGSTLGRSNISNNIKLHLNYKPDERKLLWNSYSSWAAGVSGYEIWRTTVKHGQTTEELVKVLDDATLMHTDADFIESDARPGICYFIKAIEKNGNPYGFKKESYSNFVCYTVPSIVTIPNAFYPDGIYNKVFLPVTLYADSTQSKFSVYNRWGEKIITDQEVWKGWDGKLPNGSNAPEGVYLYRLEVIGIDKSQRTYSAPFTLLR